MYVLDRFGRSSSLEWSISGTYALRSPLLTHATVPRWISFPCNMMPDACAGYELTIDNVLQSVTAHLSEPLFKAPLQRSSS